MVAVQMVRRLLRFALRTVLVPALVAATFLGVTGGGRGTASVTPSATKIAASLSKHHELPKNTTLIVGDPDKPTTVTYDDKGRLLVTPPRGETFGTIVWRGFGELSRIAGKAGVNLEQAAAAPAASATAHAK